jgi:hypothetical protein
MAEAYHRVAPPQGLSGARALGHFASLITLRARLTVLLAYKLALASPHVSAAAIEAGEFPRLAEELEVWAVPRIVVNGVPQWDGSVREPVSVDRVLAPSFE